jgi:hypothetical protein
MLDLAERIIRGNTAIEVRSEGEMSSLDLGLTTDDGEYETQSDDTMTVDKWHYEMRHK